MSPFTLMKLRLVRSMRNASAEVPSGSERVTSQEPSVRSGLVAPNTRSHALGYGN